MEKHTPGPWEVGPESHDYYYDGFSVCVAGKTDSVTLGLASCIASDADARLMAASPDLLAALRSVNELISEAALTGFNCRDGDWAQRLYDSQQNTSAAIAKAVGAGPKKTREEG